MTNEIACPFEEGVYRDASGIEFEAVVKRARSKEQMDEPLPKPATARTAESLPWVERDTDAAEEDAKGDGG
jgi:hypothetical protein